MHRRLADGEALRITKTSNITMFLMRFPIDAIFLDHGGRVVRAAPNLRPWVLLIAARGAAEVVELRAGIIAESSTQAGDDLVFEDAQ